MEQKTIQELIVNPPKFVEVVTQEWEKFSWYQAGRLPCKQLIIERLVQMGEGVQINYVRPDTMLPSYVTVPNAFLARILPPEKYTDLEEKYTKYVLANLHKVCVFNGSIGSDPEIFVETRRGKIIPAFEFLGSKKEPTLAPERNEHCEIADGQNACYWDGFQAEFSTFPSFCMGWHGDSIQCGLEGIYLAMKKHKRGAKLSCKTVFDIPPEMMLEAKPEHVQFGCMPSYNAYGMKGLDLPGHEVPFRSAGGHVHLSFNSVSLKNKEIYIKMVKALDAILGVACVSMFAKYDDPRRRQMYGLAGEYRLPPHGLEYRVLSNAWLFHPLIANIVFDLARTAAMFGAKDLLPHWQCSEAETIRIINQCDVTAAREVLNKNKNLFLKILNVMYSKNDSTERFAKYSFDVIINGMESVIEDVSDIAGNWDLGKQWIRHCDGWGKNVFKIHEEELVGTKV